MSSIKSAIEHAIQYLKNDLHLNESARPEAQEIVRKLQAADLPAESNDKYTDLKDYIGGKISEMYDCDECALTDHQASHLHDIEAHLAKLEEGSPGSSVEPTKIHLVVTVSSEYIEDGGDTYEEIVGAYEDLNKTCEVQKQIANREPLEGLNYNLMRDFNNCEVISLPLNAHITHPIE